MNNKFSISCPVCAHKGVDLFAVTVDYEDRNDGREYSAYRCHNCSAIFQYPFPDLKDFDNLYPEDYYAHIEYPKIPTLTRLFDFFLDHKIAVVLLKPLVRFVFPYFNVVRNSNVILDVGCGKGTFLNVLKKYGKETYGIEPDSNAVAILNKNGHKAIKGDISSSNYSDNIFDAVTLFQVLEHIGNPVELMKEAFRILKPGGHLIIQTPNSESDLANRYKSFWRSLELPRHLILHCMKSINYLCGNYGCDIKMSVRVSPTDVRESFLLKKGLFRSPDNLSFKVRMIFKTGFSFLFRNRQGSLLTVIVQKPV